MPDENPWEPTCSKCGAELQGAPFDDGPGDGDRLRWCWSGGHAYTANEVIA